MGIRDWMQRRMARYDGGQELPAFASALHSWVREDRAAPHSLGDFDARSYPPELAEQLRRRARVAERLLELDLTTRAARVEAIPRLRELLRDYPHPLAYEALINAYVDDRRWDEARGLAFAVRSRRRECEASPYPEIRMETDRLFTWSPEEVEALQLESQADPQVH